ncbi:4-diphosphocytidyl-2-C-methyl-D-erythritol kinase [Sphaerisporangium krabiense]|uniref:4-diphosphocytidyl-2-C-methyl-D-erythritol kinase n=1 Tax=Sphaerisporangium krabiense TaxID=763782 RepID=A0A7W8Z530_9ACTN|nr:4-(cytidine 5'-diphospho)-2-C-methyl-D-erythritol kinase [Sphaerisporangium krabiense]MBB5627238.1 4-diphosphocytidyl-2-C-methyl-D-erythritol kinase [Sphaerisporangium krabiense]GII64629.1 4-diphosphocytidyl-2-C-methyl-D-erythritol kinase [Sphaerisporangium krabiense]
MTSVTVRVPAKVNLQLSVGPRRDDGYHDLVNVFHAVSLFDEVTASDEPAPREASGGPPVAVTVEGESSGQVPLDGSNLAVRAALALAVRAGRPPDVRLRIRKAIPVAGGMAGGSADAAATLVACDALWGLGAAQDDLMELAADLGSDVPFALVGGTAVGTGRGEKLSPAPVAGRFHWVFALAEGGLSTADVYAECDRLREATGEQVGWPRVADGLMEALARGDAKALGQMLDNDLQAAALLLCRPLARTLAAGREHGALGALVSGSGPTCAFLADSEDHATSLAASLEAAGVCRRALTAHGPVQGAEVVP